ncbi:MAG: twin-arginine translocase TatA/TatE family subunit [Humidesulfovibrio sp.]|uniref:twin-arginine translocase TatA/TatE family subunit n=1 Tax=Humidesulfovibrio sp. TaxID=2910988 RepID=UPI0027E9AF53|nr:twin-arginine translocase TatA/TatE family subunit [Humidesulfovibrio sp.]MDQ7834193.1 twin-arginine translocase TatA/TatE family subunit [Humidesulfovibrio sp.]
MLGELFQPMHLLLILVIALLLFGPGKLPQIAANLGKSIREFKGALSAQEEVTVAPPAQQPTQAQPTQAAQAAQPQAAQPQAAPAQAEAPKQEQKSA